MNKGSELYKKAKKIIPGGTMLLSKRPEMFLPNLWPAYFSKSKGCKIWDLEGNELVDMSIMGIGTNTLGYGHEVVDNAVMENTKIGSVVPLNTKWTDIGDWKSLWEYENKNQDFHREFI